MNVFPASATRPRFDFESLTRAGLLVAGALVLSAALAPVIAQPLPSTQVVVGVGVGLLALLGLTLASMDLALAVGLLTFGLVRAEPAPTDAIFAVVLAVAIATGRFRIDRVPVSITGLLTLYIALNLVSSTAAIDNGDALRFGLVTVYLIGLGIWLAGYVDSVRRARIVVRTFVFGAAAVAAIGALAVVTTFPGHSFFAGDFYRAQGSFKDPNVFGHSMIPALLIVLDELVSPRLLPRRPLLKWLLVGALSCGIFFSYSRSAWLAASMAIVAILAINLLRRGGGRRAFLFVGVALTTVAAVVIVVAFTGSVGFVEDRARFQRYDTERFAAQEAGIRLVGEYPFGIGPGQFEEVLSISAHSTYVRALAEQGLLGLAVILLLVFTTLLLGARNVVVGQSTFGIGSAPLFASWCAIVFASLVIDTIHWRHLWLVAALIWAGSAIRSSPLRS